MKDSFERKITSPEITSSSDCSLEGLTEVCSSAEYVGAIATNDERLPRMKHYVFALVLFDLEFDYVPLLNPRSRLRS